MTREQRLTLTACVLASATAFIDQTVVNVALPALRDDLGAGLAGQQWVVEAYLLMLGSLVLVGGSLGDLLGRRRVFAIGSAGFGTMSLACAAAPSTGVLIAARAGQGVFAALLVPSSLAIITATFDGERRGTAIGLWTAWTSGAIALGPPLGGLLVDAVSWRLVFAINVPLLAVTLYLIRTAVPEMPGRPGARVDVLGGVLCAAGLGGIVSGLIEREPLLVAAGAVVLAGFLWWERRAPQPMLPLGTFSSRTFAAGNATTFAVYAGLGAATFFIALFLQQVGGYSATEGGLSLLPISVAIVTLSRRAGALAERTGPRLLMGSGPLVTAAGLLLLALRVDEHARYLADVLPGIALFGLGMAMTVAPLTAAVLGSVETGRAGVASGVNNAVARVASLVAIAGVGAIVAAQFGPGGPGRGFSATDAATSVDALHAGLFACAILMAAGGLIAFAGIEKGPRNA